MSRIRTAEVSSPISLFPFIGILLCTMGALLVILVAVSRSAGDSAKREVIERQQAVAASAGPSDEDRDKLKQIERYVASLDHVKGAAETKIRSEQARLSHLEDHIRRLQTQLKSLQTAAGELESLEEQHFDDREQAEREVKRLLELAAESQTTIDELKQQASTEKRSYALVPYDGPNGTHRRPIYVECADDQIVLQPEGAKIARDDLYPPFTAGNPLAAALRAARDHLVRLHPGEGQTRDTEPYPLLLVRPSGLIMYNRAREAIEAGDFDLGFELVENDWELKYPAPDPNLLAIEQQAIEHALKRQALLAEAAPRAYSHPGLAAAGEFEFEDEGSGGGGYGSGGSGSGTYLARAGGEGGSGESGYGEAGGGGGDEGQGGEGEYGAGGSSVDGGTSTSSASGAAGGAAGYGSAGVAGSGGYGGSGGNLAGGTAANGGVAGGGPGAPQPGGPTAGANCGGGTPGSGPMGAAGSGMSGVSQDDGGAGLPGDSEQQPNNLNVMTGSPPPDYQADGRNDSKSRRPGSGEEQPDLSKSRGKDWALGKLPQRSVPVRRTIRVVVRQDQLAILNDEDVSNSSLPVGDVVPMKGDTVEALDPFVKQVRERIESWGIAGNGLYWRPELLLSVGPDGQRRAHDLSRLLKNSGLDVRTNQTARRTGEGHGHETR